MYVSRPFEHVAKVFSLRPIKRNYRFHDVLTDDNTPLAMKSISPMGSTSTRTDVFGRED